MLVVAVAVAAAVVVVVEVVVVVATRVVVVVVGANGQGFSSQLSEVAFSSFGLQHPAVATPGS